MTSDEFLSLLGYENPQYHMKDYIENYLTLDRGFISFAETYYEKYDFILLSNDVSEWSSYITEYYQLNKYFKSKDELVGNDLKHIFKEECGDNTKTMKKRKIYTGLAFLCGTIASIWFFSANIFRYDEMLSIIAA